MQNTLIDFVKVIKDNNIKPESVLDIGSRDGTDADFIKKCLDIKNENVHIVEPNPIYVNVAKNKFSKYNIHSVAFSDKNGINKFYQVNTNRDDINGMSSLLNRKIYKDKYLNVNEIQVETITGFQFMEKNNIKNYILKIDVEGHTYEVIKGFGDYIKQAMAIHLESEDRVIWENQKTTNDIYALLSNQFIQVKIKGVLCEYYEFPEENYIQYDEIWVNKKHFEYNINNYFDKVYYLNMDKDYERKNNILTQFNKFNITNYKRISGLQIEEVPQKHYWRNFNLKNLTEKYIKGQLGCRNTHWRAVEDAYLNGYQRVLIFEDDIIFNQDPNLVLQQNINLLNKWDMLYYSGVEEHHFGGQIVLAHAYALNRKLIEEIYYMLPTSGMEVDNFYAKVLFHMSYNYSPTGKYLIHKMNPFNTIIQNNSYSSNIKP